ncbi:hypothetical protein [Caballeronia calidae]|uniref:hypothetical protein n=1 Tax=Caballeronia calidae TaxID=1777139 RepID=UPI0018DF30E8|nr:hypothetical protein [Caballeronia calidae]
MVMRDPLGRGRGAIDRLKANENQNRLFQSSSAESSACPIGCAQGRQQAEGFELNLRNSYQDDCVALKAHANSLK